MYSICRQFARNNKTNMVNYKAYNTTRLSKLLFSVSPFPMRVGYGLGSVIQPKVIESMKKEGTLRGKIRELEEIDNELESLQVQLTLEKNQITNDFDDSQEIQLDSKEAEILLNEINELRKTRDRVLNEKIAAYRDLVKFQSSVIDESGNKLTTFDYHIPSPIDWRQSTITYLDRSNDSIQVNAQFFITNSGSESAASNINNIVGAVRANTKKFGQELRGSLTKAVHDSLSHTHEIHEVESTLLLTATAFHRFVKQCQPLILDPDQLYDCWNAMFPTDKVDMNLIGNLAHQNSIGSDNKLGIITEEYLGSAMIGMVHFIKKEDTESTQSASARAMKAELSVKQASAFSSLIGDAGLAEQIAEKAANALSSTGIDIKFDLICQGYMPRLQSQAITEAIKEFKSFSPDKFNVTQKGDSLLFPDMNKEQNMLINDNKTQSIKQSQSGAMIKSTIMGLAKAYETGNNVLDYKSFMNALDDYTKNVSKTKGNGVPCGMNIKTLTKLEVRTLIERKWSPDTANPTGYGSGQLSADHAKKNKTANQNQVNQQDDDDDDEEEEEEPDDEEEEDYDDEEEGDDEDYDEGEEEEYDDEE